MKPMKCGGDFCKPLPRGRWRHGLGQAEAVAADDAIPSPPSDVAQRLEPQQANLGSLFPLVEQLAGGGEYPYSFLSEKFQTLDDFKPAARAKVLESYGYRPPKVDLKPEVLDRQDCGDFVREVVLHIAAFLRVPAYVLIPKGLTKPAPAIVDLHSHGGMFLFGKEKVIDFGVQSSGDDQAYHQRQLRRTADATELVRHGYVVITIDALMFGERRVLRRRRPEATVGTARNTRSTT